MACGELPFKHRQVCLTPSCMRSALHISPPPKEVGEVMLDLEHDTDQQSCQQR